MNKRKHQARSEVVDGDESFEEVIDDDDDDDRDNAPASAPSSVKRKKKPNSIHDHRNVKNKVIKPKGINDALKDFQNTFGIGSPSSPSAYSSSSSIPKGVSSPMQSCNRLVLMPSNDSTINTFTQEQ